MTRHPSARVTPITTLIAAAALLALTPTIVQAETSTSERPAQPTTTSSDVEPFIYVALGDSWTHGSHCGFCRTFAGRYADGLPDVAGRPVVFVDDTVNGGTTSSMLDDLSDDYFHFRGDVAAADIVMISTGINDIEQALVDAGNGQCGGPANTDCFDDVAQGWKTNFDQMLTEIEEIRGGQPTAIRLVTAHNIFVSDPTIARDFNLPADFATTTGVEITAMQRDAMCEAAERHDALCVDVALLLNGDGLDQPADENSPRITSSSRRRPPRHRTTRTPRIPERSPDRAAARPRRRRIGLKRRLKR
jgi:lysophospholipase L1-like esterase